MRVPEIDEFVLLQMCAAVKDQAEVLHRITELFGCTRTLQAQVEVRLKAIDDDPREIRSEIAVLQIQNLCWKSRASYALH